ncbi:hypothetical protein [Flavipsychrobacter stenotrophus]|nr:hypothetical protein [Flavipsychrobacter stenotrophus]
MLQIAAGRLVSDILSVTRATVKINNYYKNMVQKLIHIKIAVTLYEQ